MSRKAFILMAVAAFLPAMVMGATVVSWISPDNGSSFLVGTSVNVTGNANASGQTGGTGLDLALVIDTSGSMNSSNRLVTAKQAAIELVNALPGATSSVGVVRFSSSASTVLGMTSVSNDKQSIINSINSLSAGGGTNIGAGVSQGESTINSGHTTGRTKMQVLLSDGSGSYSGQAASAFNNSDIVTHTVGVPGHNATLMQQVANDGNGTYTASSLTELISLFNGTGGNLVGLDRVDITLPDGTVLNDYATDGLGNFQLDWNILLGANNFSATAFGSDGSSATANWTLFGTAAQPIPEPTSVMLLFVGLAFFGLRKKLS